jgi:hypothetical protein
VPHAANLDAVEQEHESLQARFGTTGFQHASPFAKATYSFVTPLVKLGAQSKARRAMALPVHSAHLLWRVQPLRLHATCVLSHILPLSCMPACLPQIHDGSAAAYLPLSDTGERLAAQFDAAYASVKVCGSAATAPADLHHAHHSASSGIPQIATPLASSIAAGSLVASLESTLIALTCLGVLTLLAGVPCRRSRSAGGGTGPPVGSCGAPTGASTSEAVLGLLGFRACAAST